VTSRLLDALIARPLLLDAGMGTRLIARGLDLTKDDTALWNLTHPADVREIHELDIAAGSDAILTNTFGANAGWLERYGRAGESAAINRRAVALARDAAGADRFVLGSIGPSAADKAGAYREQAEALAESGVDGLLLETHTLDRALVGLAEIGPAVDLPMLVSLTDWGIDPLAGAVRLIRAGADVLGINCKVTPPAGVVFAAIRGVSKIPFLVKPTGQRPGRPAIRPQDFASVVPAWLEWGVRLMGGCCGATEAHVAAMRSALDEATAGEV
jgi:methionine synthase I (cobalamin-dependent)